MSFLPLQLQIVSDLHLETPISKPAYLSFRLHVTGTHLFLLGDIGLVKDTGLFTFLRHLLDSHRGTRVFYVLGNHEAYQTTLHHAVSKLRDFEKKPPSNMVPGFDFCIAIAWISIPR
jgi:UDP-2,3-diacylglucosamine pyrophosphatase LpxH